MMRIKQREGVFDGRAAIQKMVHWETKKKGAYRRDGQKQHLLGTRNESQTKVIPKERQITSIERILNGITINSKHCKIGDKEHKTIKWERKEVQQIVVRKLN